MSYSRRSLASSLLALIILVLPVLQAVAGCQSGASTLPDNAWADAGQDSGSQARDSGNGGRPDASRPDGGDKPKADASTDASMDSGDGGKPDGGNVCRASGAKCAAWSECCSQTCRIGRTAAAKCASRGARA